MSAAPAPPGYAVRTRPADGEAEPIPLSLSAFVAGSASTLLFTFHELVLAMPRAYTFDGDSRLASAVLAVCALLVGAAWGSLIRAPASHAPTALAAVSLLSSASGYAFLAAFSRGALLDAARVLVPAAAGVGLGLSATLLARAFGSGLNALNALTHFLNPLRAGAIAALWLLVLLGLPVLGLVRRAALFGSLLAGLALLTPGVTALFALRAPASRLGRALTVLAPFAALGALLGASRFIPLADIRDHKGEVVYTLAGPRGHHVVTKLQGGLVLFSDHVVSSTSADAARFAEALVHPALAVAESRASVLVLDDAAGAVVREVLRWPDVRRLTLVPRDPALFRLARVSSAFHGLGGGALGSPRVTPSTLETSLFVLQGRERYQVIVANLGDPSTYLEGKYYTVRFFEALRARLAPGGHLALQVTSPERTPSTHATILATLSRAGFSVLPYRAPLATLGEWGFALAVAATPQGEQALAARLRAIRHVPGGTQLITHQTLGALLARPEAGNSSGASPSFLYDQPLVELYQDEEHALSE